MTNIHALVVGHLEDPLGSLTCINQRPHLRHAVNPRINNMVPCKPETVIPEDSGLS